MAKNIGGRFYALGREHESKSYAQNRRGTKSYFDVHGLRFVHRRLRNLSARRAADMWKKAEHALDVGSKFDFDSLPRLARLMTNQVVMP